MSFKVTIKKELVYGHRLCLHPGGCANIHGHSATVEAEFLSDSLNESGFVVDFDVIDKALGSVLSALDHQLILYAEDPLAAKLGELGESPLLISEHPSAEAIARLIFDRAATALPKDAQPSAIRLWETERFCAEYRA